MAIVEFGLHLRAGEAREHFPMPLLDECTLQFRYRIFTSKILRAPADGVVSDRNKEVAANDTEGGTSQTGSRVAKIEDRFLLHALEFESVLRACLYRYSRNTSDVEELLQETYARLLVAGSAAQPNVRSMRAFCLTVARNVALDWLRHRQIVPIDLVADMEALDILDEGAQIEEIVNAHQELALLANAVEQLPARCRQVFTLRKVYGYSQKEIAERLQISENTVEQHLTKAARRCAQILFESPQTAMEDNGMFAKLRRRMKLHDKSA